MVPTSVKVLAIIGIVLGVLGFCGSIWAGIVTFSGIDFGPNPLLDALNGDAVYRVVSAISLAIGTGLVILLVTSSIGSLMLKPWARKGMIVYAWVAICQVIVGVVFNGAYVFPKMFAAIPAAAPPAERAGLIGGIIGGGCGMILGLVFPICILYFFSRPRVLDAFNGIFPVMPTNFPVEVPPPPGESPDSQFP